MRKGDFFRRIFSAKNRLPHRPKGLNWRFSPVSRKSPPTRRWRKSLPFKRAVFAKLPPVASFFEEKTGCSTTLVFSLK